MSSAKVLFVITSNEHMGDTSKPTGVWFEELATPYYSFIDAGIAPVLASTQGGQVPIDPNSQKVVGENPKSVDRFLQDGEAMAKLADTVAIDSIDTSKYDAIFLPGGHGTMWDLPQSEALAKAVAGALSSDKIVAAVCHGPAGLTAATYDDGTPVVKGRTVSAFTDSEEEAMQLTDSVPFLLESRLRELGAIIEKGEDFEPFAVADRNLITGQNPASSAKVAELVINQLQEKQPESARAASI